MAIITTDTPNPEPAENNLQRRRFACVEGFSTLYKFTPFDTPTRRRWVTETLQPPHRIYFASPSQLNDEFDLRPLVRLPSGLPERELRALLLSDAEQHWGRQASALTAEQIEIYGSRLRTIGIEKFEREAEERTHRRIEEHYGVFSLACDPGRIEMWDEYADHRRGSPSIMRRVQPESVRYLRLNESRATAVTSVILPDEGEEAHKFVREAVQAFPELYFSRLVILGEGDSEEIVLPRFLEARGLAQDDSSISVVPLGGRHVNHFWRLLHGLQIPFVTLLDLDLARHQGGWGRIRYAITELMKFPTIGTNLTEAHLKGLPKWDAADQLPKSEKRKQWVDFLESVGVFFSAPLDLDFALLEKFPNAYGVDENELMEPDEDIIVAVLGKSHGDPSQYSDSRRSSFGAYHSRFKLGSKPAAHLAAMAELDNEEINFDMPKAIGRLLKHSAQELGRLLAPILRRPSFR